jgi:GNAT superfamily N-acetyltransferase
MKGPDPEIRTLRPTEREAFLDLLDGWKLRDGWRGRDFFRRYLELDPEYTDENVWVAEVGGRLVSCVQVFPRRLRSTAGEVPCGGIGSVFTAPSHRGRGLASRLLGAAAGAMRGRGMEVSVLVAARLDWYSGLGWRVWGPPQYRLHRIGRERGEAPSRRPPAAVERGAPAGGTAGGWELADVDPARDPAASEVLCELAARYGESVVGTVARGRSGWSASLRLAGNPEERFRAARVGGRTIAFVRACRLDGKRQVTEWAFDPGAESALAALLLDELPARGALPLPPVPDAALFGELERRGSVVERPTGAAWMLRCVDRDALARRLRVAPEEAGRLDEAVLLARLFPRERFGFWTADRF